LWILAHQSRRAADLIEQAEAMLEEASGVIANGYLRLDPQEWIKAVENRQAALGRVAGVLSELRFLLAWSFGGGWRSGDSLSARPRLI
jgi:hypothetical protein